MALINKIIGAAVTTAVTYYVGKMVTAALERKPLNTRVREAKEKAGELKSTARSKVDHVKLAARTKYEDLSQRTHRLIDEQPARSVSDEHKEL